MDLGDHGLPFQSHFYERWEDVTSQEPSTGWFRESRVSLNSCSRHFTINYIDITGFTLDGKSDLVTACSPLIHVLHAFSLHRRIMPDHWIRDQPFRKDVIVQCNMRIYRTLNMSCRWPEYAHDRVRLSRCSAPATLDLTAGKLGRVLVAGGMA
jgi:hypothetical protein